MWQSSWFKNLILTVELEMCSTDLLYIYLLFHPSNFQMKFAEVVSPQILNSLCFAALFADFGELIL